MLNTKLNTLLSQMKLEFDGKEWKVVDPTQLSFYEIKTPKGNIMTIINDKTINNNKTFNNKWEKVNKFYKNCIPILEENSFVNSMGTLILYRYFLDIDCQENYEAILASTLIDENKDSIKTVLDLHKKLLEHKVLEYDKQEEQRKLIHQTCNSLLNFLDKVDLYNFVEKTEKYTDKKRKNK